MNQKKLIQEFERLIKSDTIQDCSDVIDIYLNYFLKVMRLHHHQAKSQADLDAEIINQMVFTKIDNLKELIKGIKYFRNDETPFENIIDPTIVATNIRNLYETIGMFNLIYINTKTEDEKIVLYNLWVLSGLKYRQKFRVNIKTVENENKLERENKQIAELKLEIENTELYKSLNNKEQMDTI